MKIVIAMDSFKGSLSSVEAGQRVAAGIKRVLPHAQISILPLADGGEGTAATIAYALKGEYHYVEVFDPLGRKITGSFVLLPDGTAVIELATASGLTLLTEKEKNPYLTTTYGTGQLIKAALTIGAEKLIIGLGGSATNDGGSGLLRALGVKFLDSNKQELPYGGIYLKGLDEIDDRKMLPAFRKVPILIASDVNNPLLGPEGASAVFGPQKGATPEAVSKLDVALARYNTVLQNKLGRDFKDIKGAGAAGGSTVALLAFGQANIVPGIELILDLLNFDFHLEKADLLIGGEGRIDKQTLSGKTLMGLAGRAKAHGVPFLALAGSIGEETAELYRHGVTSMLPIASGPISLKESLEKAEDLITDTSERAIRLFIGGKVKD